MADEVGLTIDGRRVRVEAGATILTAAEQAGIEIPVICYFAHTTANGLCRMCVVETSGTKGLQPACVAAVRQGAEIETRSPNVTRARRTILEMLAATVDLSEAPEIEKMLQEYGAEPGRFAGGAHRRPPLLDDNPVYIRDYAKCVLCWRCVQVCAEDAQYAFAINFSGRGFNSSIATFFDKPMPETTCVFCGQCVGVCPTGALKAKREYLLEQGVSLIDVFHETRMRRAGKRSAGGARIDKEG